MFKDFADTLGSLGQEAGTFWNGYTNAAANKKNADAANKNAQANLLSAASLQKAIPWAIGGLAVLLVVLVASRKAKGG